jgi:hypothetical protein
MSFLRHHHQDVLGRSSAPALSPTYGNNEALVDILTGEIIAGALPLGVRSLVRQWTELHREELVADWNLASTLQPLRRIEPLP